MGKGSLGIVMHIGGILILWIPEELLAILSFWEKTKKKVLCNRLLSIARSPEGDPAILGGQGEEAWIEISTRDIIKMRDQ